LKILVYSSVFYPGIGGIENHTLILIREFVRAGHEVKVITEQRQDPSRPLHNVEVVHSSRKLTQLKLFFWSDVMYMPNITLKGVWLMLFNPFKTWVISHNDFHLSQSPAVRKGLKHFFVRLATRHVAVSRSVADFLHVESTVIHNCYDDDVFRLYPDEARRLDLVFVGRLVSQKGCDLLIEACGHLDRPFMLSVVGKGPDLAALQAKVEAMGLERQVRFLGFQQGEVLARTLNRHRAMVVPSRGDEGFGIVALEGLACGCKLLVSDAGGLVEAIGKHGQVFRRGDVEGLRELLRECLDADWEDPMPPERVRHLKHHGKADVAGRYLQVFFARSDGTTEATKARS